MSWCWHSSMKARNPRTRLLAFGYCECHRRDVDIFWFYSIWNCFFAFNEDHLCGPRRENPRLVEGRLDLDTRRLERKKWGRCRTLQATFREDRDILIVALVSFSHYFNFSFLLVFILFLFLFLEITFFGFPEACVEWASSSPLDLVLSTREFFSPEPVFG